MKKLFVLLFAVIIAVSFASCSGSGQSNNEPSESISETETEQESVTQAAKVDFSSLNWVEGELDCYGYNDCYMSYKYPDVFKLGKEDSSGLQYRGYNYNPENPEASANESPYGVYIYFNQGAYGAKRNTLEPDIEGGFTERELGGRKVLFGEGKRDEVTGAYTFSYYVQYDEEEYSRIWFILCDAEEDGEFRRIFEQSISFEKNN